MELSEVSGASDNVQIQLTAPPGLPNDGSTKRRWERHQPQAPDYSHTDSTLEELRHVPIAHTPPHTSGTAETPVEVASLTSAQKSYQRKRTWICFVTCIWCMFIQGWNDGSTVFHTFATFPSIFELPIH